MCFCLRFLVVFSEHSLESHSCYLMTVNGYLMTLVLLLFGEINFYRGEIITFACFFYATSVNRNKIAK